MEGENGLTRIQHIHLQRRRRLGPTAWAKKKKRKKLFNGNSKKINVIFTHETEMRNAPAHLLIVRLWRLFQFDID